MFKSRAVAYVKPSSSCRTVLILGIGNGFLTTHLFTSLKSPTTLTVLSFFGMINVGDAHWESSCHLSTPKLHSLRTSFLVVSTYFLGIGKGRPWYGCAPSFNWRETGLQSQSPIVPLNSSSKSCRRSSNNIYSGALTCVQLSLTISLRFAFSYLASRIVWGT